MALRFVCFAASLVLALPSWGSINLPHVFLFSGCQRILLNPVISGDFQFILAKIFATDERQEALNQSLRIKMQEVVDDIHDTSWLVPHPVTLTLHQLFMKKLMIKPWQVAWIQRTDAITGLPYADVYTPSDLAHEFENTFNFVSLNGLKIENPKAWIFADQDRQDAKTALKLLWQGGNPRFRSTQEIQYVLDTFDDKIKNEIESNPDLAWFQPIWADFVLRLEKILEEP